MTKKKCSYHWPWWPAQGVSVPRPSRGVFKVNCWWENFWSPNSNSIEPMACKRAQANHSVHTASTCAYNLRSRNKNLKLSKAQAKHNVHIANTCAYNLRSQNRTLNLSMASWWAVAQLNVHIVAVVWIINVKIDPEKNAPTTSPGGQPKGSRYREPLGGCSKSVVDEKKIDHQIQTLSSLWHAREPRLITMCTQPAHVHTTWDHKIEFWS
jgi:hypothetical protein